MTDILNPRITEAGLEAATATLTNTHGKTVTIVSLPMAAPEGYWAQVRTREYPGIAFYDYRHPDSHGLRGIKKKLAESFMASIRTLFRAGDLILADEGVSTPASSWRETPEPMGRPKIRLTALLLISIFARMMSALDQRDDVRAFYLRSFATGPKAPDKRPGWAAGIDTHLTERAEQIAEHLHRKAGDTTIVTGAGKSTTILTWLEGHGYQVERVEYTLVLASEDFGAKYHEAVPSEVTPRMDGA